MGQPWTKLIPFMVQEFVVHESGKTHTMVLMFNDTYREYVILLLTTVN